MTPEETKAMAERIAANRREATKTVPKEAPKEEKPVKAPKVVKAKAKEVKAPKATKAKRPAAKRSVGPGTKKFHFKEGTRSREVCDVLRCNAKPKAGFRCEKHRKEIRKEQLRANNVVWHKRVKDGTAGHHVVYTRPGEKKPIATRWSISKKTTDLAVKKVSTGHSVIEKIGELKEIIARTKKMRAA